MWIICQGGLPAYGGHIRVHMHEGPGSASRFPRSRGIDHTAEQKIFSFYGEWDTVTLTHPLSIDIQGDELVSTPPPTGPMPTLAERLNWLIKNVPDTEGKPFSMWSLAKRTKELASVQAEALLQTGASQHEAEEYVKHHSVGDSTVGRLLDGSVTNPRLDTVYALADAFALPRTVLLDTPYMNSIFELALSGDAKGKEMIFEMRNLRVAAEQGVIDLALRASAVASTSPDARRSVDAFLRVFEANAHLLSPDEDDEDEDAQ